MNVVESSKASMDGFLLRIKRSAYYNEIPYSCIASCGGSCYTLYRTSLYPIKCCAICATKGGRYHAAAQITSWRRLQPGTVAGPARYSGAGHRTDEKAHVNTVTLGVFSWSTLEPQEGYLSWIGWLTSSITCMPMESIRSLQRPVRPALLGWHTNTPRCAESGQTGSGSCTTGGRITAIHRRSTGKSPHHRPEAGTAVRQ